MENEMLIDIPDYQRQSEKSNKAINLDTTGSCQMPGNVTWCRHAFNWPNDLHSTCFNQTYPSIIKNYVPIQIQHDNIRKNTIKKILALLKKKKKSTKHSCCYYGHIDLEKKHLFVFFQHDLKIIWAQFLAVAAKYLITRWCCPQIAQVPLQCQWSLTLIRYT